MQDLPVRKGTLKFILSIKPRQFLLVGLCLAALFLTIVVVGIRENRSNVIRMMKNEARALVESIISAGRNTLAATDMVDRLVLDNLSDIATVVGHRFEGGDLTPTEIARTCHATGINRMDVIDSVGIVAVSSVVDMIGREYDSSFVSRFPFDDIVMGRIRSASFVLDDENPVIPAQLVLATARIDAPGAVILFADYSILERFNDRIGIGSLVRRIGMDPEIEYVFMQSYEGVIFSSHSFGQVKRIEADEFLLSILEEGGYGSRIVPFEGRDVLEVARPFITEGLPPGLLRIGLSMDGYEQVTGNFEYQLIAIGTILFIVSFLVVTLFLANLNYRTLESSYVTMKTLTGNILDSMQSAVVVVNESGEITLFNPRAEGMFGFRQTEATGKSYSKLFDGDPLMLAEVAQGASATIRTEKTVTAKDGRKLSLLVVASKVTSEDGNPIGAVAVSYDVTESRKLERVAKRSERLSELGNLAAGVAHEIRNPLNSISIASQRLRSEFTPESDRDEYDQLVGNIKAEIERLNEIIIQFLALARTHATKQEVFDLSEMCNDVMRLMQQEAADKGIRLAADVNRDLIMKGNPDEIRKVLINLIKNSIEACHSGASIRVSASALSDSELRMAVEDDGPGIDRGDQDKIFRPYFTTKDGGTGLGLALSHRIISDHDGSLEYEDRAGGGAIFTATLPRLQEVTDDT